VVRSLRAGRCRPLMFLEELDHQRTRLDMIGGLVSAGGGFRLAGRGHGV
jgi:hypothetical protein